MAYRGAVINELEEEGGNLGNATVNKKVTVSPEYARSMIGLLPVP